MKLSDIIDAAEQNNPNLDVFIDVEGEDEQRQVTFRNIMVIAAPTRKKLFEDLGKARETEGVDAIRLTADTAKSFLRSTCEDKDGFKLIEQAFRANKNLEDAAWTQLFSDYQDATKLGEATSSQDS